MANRKQRAHIALETVKILESGMYRFGDNADVSIDEALNMAQCRTELYTPESIDRLTASLDPPSPRKTSFEVLNCTTFAAVRKLIASNVVDPVCLNFASAKNPGGGFLSGSQAQEECLARASGLYACLTQQLIYYEVNRTCSTSLYTNHAIYSPRVPVFRDEDDGLIEHPYSVSIITSPAVNAGAVRQNEPLNLDRIAPIMKHRIQAVLAIARQHQHDSLVLGAWGCGVFKNEPADIARWFH
ncbi:MAG: TIGR02452 family protein [Thermosynechococcaceae cyanobacterium]